MSQTGPRSIPSVSTWEFLRSLGFLEDRAVISDSMPGLSMEIEGFVLSAATVSSRYLTPVIMLNGVWKTERKMREVEMELPTELESIECGKALIAWCLDDAAEGSFPFTSPPAWVLEGRQNRHLLPWEQERIAYASRDHCIIERDRARLAFKKLAMQLAVTQNEASVTLAFDGTVFKICCLDFICAMPARGNPWKQSFLIKAGAIRRLPGRFMDEQIEVSIQNSSLNIGRRRYSGITAIA